MIARTRDVLRRYAGPDQLYQLMVARAGRAGEPIRFARVFPAAGAVVTGAYEVPSPYTLPGWAAMDSALGRVDEFLRAEDWVVGENAPVQVAYGLMTMLQNIGLMTFNLVVGRLNDLSHAGPDNPRGYLPMLWLFSALSLFGLLFAFALRLRETGPHGHHLESSRAAREAASIGS